MNIRPTAIHRPVNLALYVARMQAAMVANRPIDASSLLEQQMSRQGFS
jgi:hypothetical protein